jgi:hypothetical protein
MTTPTPLLDLCDAATKGPWRQGDYTRAAIFAENNTRAIIIAHIGNENWQNDLQLIARLSPDVVRAVYEALRDSRIYIRCEFGEDDWRLTTITNALAALDGHNLNTEKKP